MGYDELILMSDSAAIISLLVMALLLCSASRFKGDSSYAALVTVFASVPIYTYNICCYLELNGAVGILFRICTAVNLSIMPLLWLLFQKDRLQHSFTVSGMLHFVPAILSQFLLSRMLCCFCLIVGAAQIIGYIFALFRTICDKDKTTPDGKSWYYRFFSIITVSFAIRIISDVMEFEPGLWFNRLLNIIAMCFLLYTELKTVFATLHPRKKILAETSDADTPKAKSKTDADNEEIERLMHYARQVEEYLRQSEAYINPDLSIKDVADATGIYSKNLSRAINTVLDKNFFDLINGYRVERSMTLLLVKKEKGLTIETIAEQCGFNSRFTFNTAFKKVVGMTTSQWLKTQNQQPMQFIDT